MKKIMSIIVISAMILSNIIQANQEIGLGKVIFEEEKIAFDTNTSNTLNEISYRAINFHIILAGKNIQKITDQGELLTITKELEELTTTNIMDLIQIAKDKDTTLKTYLTTCEHTIQKGEIISSYIIQEMNTIKSDMQACISEKNISDKNYFDAIKKYDYNMVKEALKNSIIYETCISKNRIEYNAKLGIARKMVFYLGILKKKYDLLNKKKHILTKNIDIINDQTLQELIELNNLLKQYNF